LTFTTLVASKKLPSLLHMAPSQENKQDSEPIAVVGYAYRAPEVGRKQLWDFLADAKSAFSHVPPDRFEHDAYYDPNSEKAGCMSSKGGHFLPDDIYAFDAPFFNMTADEATAMDPQHRMLLECAFEATESAGWPLTQLAGSR
jgi:acyl transferase domain-containing protein